MILYVIPNVATVRSTVGDGGISWTFVSSRTGRSPSEGSHGVDTGCGSRWDSSDAGLAVTSE